MVLNNKARLIIIISCLFGIISLISSAQAQGTQSNAPPPNSTAHHKTPQNPEIIPTNQATKTKRKRERKTATQIWELRPLFIDAHLEAGSRGLLSFGAEIGVLWSGDFETSLRASRSLSGWHTGLMPRFRIVLGPEVAFAYGAGANWYYQDSAVEFGFGFLGSSQQRGTFWENSGLELVTEAALQLQEKTTGTRFSFYAGGGSLIASQSKPLLYFGIRFGKSF